MQGSNLAQPHACGLARSLSLALLLTLAIFSPGCFWLHHHSKPTPEELKQHEKLRNWEQKAHAGDHKAARKLAQWHYVHDNNTQQVQYWLRVAEKHGDKAAGKVLGQMQGWQ